MRTKIKTGTLYFFLFIFLILFFTNVSAATPLLKEVSQDVPEKKDGLIYVEAYIVEAASSILNPSQEALINSAKGDTSMLLSLEGVENVSGLGAQLKKMEDIGAAKILACPRFITKVDERFELNSGVQVPVQTLANNTVTTRYVNATLELRGQLHLNTDGTISVEIDLRNNFPKFDMIKLTKGNAPINMTAWRSTTIIRDGGTAVVGGIYKVFTDDKGTECGPELLLFVSARLIDI